MRVREGVVGDRSRVREVVGGRGRSGVGRRSDRDAVSEAREVERPPRREISARSTRVYAQEFPFLEENRVLGPNKKTICIGVPFWHLYIHTSVHVCTDAKTQKGPQVLITYRYSFSIRLTHVKNRSEVRTYASILRSWSRMQRANYKPALGRRPIYVQ